VLEVRGIWLFIRFLMVLGVAMVGAFFAMENSQSLQVNFVLLDGPNLSAGVWLIIFLASGCILGLLASSLVIFSYRQKLARATKKD
jgi:uncharacterized integral membrane protein